MKKRVTDDGPSLFDTLDPTPELAVAPITPAASVDPMPDSPATPIATAIKSPTWEFTATPHIDFMAAESIVAFCYSLEELESLSNYYALPVLKQMMKALADLASARQKSLRQQAFTIYGGDVIATGVFVVGFAAKTAAIVDFLAGYMRRAPAYQSFEACASTPFIPLFRYDQGHVIQYCDPGEEGTNYTDTEEFYGSGLVIHRRLSRPADLIFSSRSVYGKLLKEG